MKLIYNIFRLLRPRQWIKNLAVFAAITFSGELFNPQVLDKVIIAFVVLCGLSSATYIVNDIFDRKSDRLHPFKKFRPLAKGDVPINLAVFIAVILAIGSFYVGLRYVTLTFFIVTVIYIVLQFLYSFFLKSVAVADILVIAAGYILRVYAGEFASGFHISVWLLLTAISLSHYSERLLDIYATMFVTSTFVFYSLFTFLENPKGFQLGLNIILPDFLPTFFYRKWLMITIAPVVYGLMRYIQDIYEKHEGESPEKVLLSDKPLLATVIIWIVLVIGIIYFITP